MARVFAVMADFDALTECRGTKHGRKSQSSPGNKNWKAGSVRSGRDAKLSRSQKVVQV